MLRPEIPDALERLEESHAGGTSDAGGGDGWSESQGDPWVLAWVAGWAMASIVEEGTGRGEGAARLVLAGPRPLAPAEMMSKR